MADAGEDGVARLGEAEFATANVFVRRSALASVGGFDERFTLAAIEKYMARIPAAATPELLPPAKALTPGTVIDLTDSGAAPAEEAAVGRVR